jgi:hypothetical protein
VEDDGEEGEEDADGDCERIGKSKVILDDGSGGCDKDGNREK